ncbi:MAG TPA: hypothetical protein DCS88_08915 [Alphaproteobacteria bacterium]|nr:hypothetical protein [Alphaproteobacteria bacterium]
MKVRNIFECGLVGEKLVNWLRRREIGPLLGLVPSGCAFSKVDCRLTHSKTDWKSVRLAVGRGLFPV